MVVSPSGVCGLYAGSADSRSGFSANMPTLGMPGNPLMNPLLVQTSLCGSGGWGRSRGGAIVFLLLLSYGSHSVLWSCKRSF